MHWFDGRVTPLNARALYATANVYELFDTEAAELLRQQACNIALELGWRTPVEERFRSSFWTSQN